VPDAVEPAVPSQSSSSSQTLASSPSSPPEQEIDTTNTPAQANTAMPVNKNTDFTVPNTYYFEGGRAVITLTNYDESANGGYFRTSLGPSQIHFLGSYQNPAKNLKITEIGIGSISKHRLQLTTALTRQLWEVGEVERSFNKALIGLRTQFSPHFDMWIGIGYMWTPRYTEVYNYRGELIVSDFVSTSVGNIGFQFLITPDFSIVFELDTLEDMGIDLFRAGLRGAF